MPISKKEKTARLIRLAEAVADRDASEDSPRSKKANKKKEKQKQKSTASEAGHSTKSGADPSIISQAEPPAGPSSKSEVPPDSQRAAQDNCEADTLALRDKLEASVSSPQPENSPSPQQSLRATTALSFETPVRPAANLGVACSDGKQRETEEDSPLFAGRDEAYCGPLQARQSAIGTQSGLSHQPENTGSPKASEVPLPNSPENSAFADSPSSPSKAPEGLLQKLRKRQFSPWRSSKPAETPGSSSSPESDLETPFSRSASMPSSTLKRPSKREAVSNFASNIASGLRRTSKPTITNPTSEPLSSQSASGNPLSNLLSSSESSGGARLSASIDDWRGFLKSAPDTRDDQASQGTSSPKASFKEEVQKISRGEERKASIEKWKSLPALGRSSATAAPERNSGVFPDKAFSALGASRRAYEGEFPSLSNNPQMSNASQGSMWSNQSNAGSRNISAPVQRNQSTPLSSQQGQDDIYSPPASRMTSQQGSFRYGAQGNVGSSQQGQPSATDDFPPLNRSGNEDMGLASQAGAGPGTGSMQSNRGNGLLNALSATSRASEARSPPGIPTPGASRPQDEGADHALPMGDGSRPSDNEGAASGPVEERDTQAPEPMDLLSGMPEADKWGIRGLRTLMNNNPDYHAMVVGLDPNSLGLDLSSPEPITNQVFSIFDDAAPRPTVAGSRPRLPDCYNVTNVQPMETKLQSFNEEALFWAFYSCPQDEKQMQAAQELHARNWRWHKKHKVWLTKDETLAPAILSPMHERGFYVVWDTTQWRKDRREFTLYYHDLETSIGQGGPGA